MIKRFVTERGSVVVDRFIVGREPVATATIAYAELYAGLTRKRRDGRLSPEQYALACRQVEEEWPAYWWAALTEEVLRSARELIQRHAIRGFDAIHLGSALALKTGLNEDVTFVAADKRLLRAAASERLVTVNVETVHDS